MNYSACGSYKRFKGKNMQKRKSAISQARPAKFRRVRLDRPQIRMKAAFYAGLCVLSRPKKVLKKPCDYRVSQDLILCWEFHAYLYARRHKHAGAKIFSA